MWRDCILKGQGTVGRVRTLPGPQGTSGVGPGCAWILTVGLPSCDVHSLGWPTLWGLIAWLERGNFSLLRTLTTWPVSTPR